MKIDGRSFTAGWAVDLVLSWGAYYLSTAIS